MPSSPAVTMFALRRLPGVASTSVSSSTGAVSSVSFDHGGADVGSKFQLAREIIDAVQHFQCLVVAEPARVFGERLGGDADAGHVVPGRFHGFAHLA